MKKTVAIIGGGAAGLFASICLARAFSGRVDVLILERCDRVGKKLLATGNGRCNFSNTNADITRYFGNNPSAIQGVLHRFTARDTMDFFEGLGVVCKVEGEGRVYPASGQGSSVLDVLRIEAAWLGVREHVNCEVMSIRSNANTNRSNQKKYVITIRGQDGISVDAVLLTTGGKASPDLGSNGSGFDIASKLGHRCTPLFPAITPIETERENIRALQGIKFMGEATLLEGNTLLRREEGEIMFTEYGLSGPPILQLSSLSGRHFNENERANLWISLNLLPKWRMEEVLVALEMRAALQGNKPLEDFFTGWLNKRMGQAVFKTAGFHPLSLKSASLGKDDWKAVAKTMQNWRIRVLRNRSFAKAQATGGGLPLDEFSPSLESVCSPGLFAAGEVLDVCGDCGGFNLQWAWASAFVAADGIIRRLS